MNKTQKKLKNIGSSPVYIISAVFLLMSSGLLIFKFFFSPQYFADLILPLLPGAEKSFVPDYYVYIQEYISYPSLLIAAVFLLTFIGMLSIYITKCKKNEKCCKLGSGKGFIKTAVIIEMILSFLFVIGLFGMQVVEITPFFVEMVDLGIIIPEYQIIRFAVLLVIMVLVIVFNSIYVKKISATIKAVDRTLKKGIIMGKVSVFLIVYNFILIAIYAMLLVFLFINDSSELIVKAGVLCLLVSRLLSNMNLISLRSEMLYIKARGFNS